jgi:acetolactate synthase-1/2/3 large subunit
MSELMTGAKIICESLLKERVDVIFGIPGGAILPFYDALWYYPQIRHVLMRHEQAAGHAAVGYARATGRVGVCVSTSGPGATNLMTGLADAKMDSTPVVAITGQVARPFLGTEAFQECDTTGMAAPLVKKTYLVMNGKDLPKIIQEAFEIAQEGRPGPVLIDIPKDVQADLTEFEMPKRQREPIPPNASTSTELLKEAADLLNGAKKPLIVAGNGVHLSGASAGLLTLAEKANIPVINTLHGTGAFPRNHQLALGMLGMHGMYWNNIATCECDVLLAIGMRFDDRVIGRPGTFASNAKVIHIEIHPSQVNKNVQADVAIIGDAKQVINKLLPLVAFKPRLVWLEKLRKLQVEHPSLLIPESEDLTPQFVLSRLNSHLQQVADPLVITGVGQHQMWSAQFLHLDRPQSFITSGGLGVMGFEVPAAIGAQVGRPEANVWSICGDGGFQMTLQELAAVTQEKLPIKYLIMNNGYHGMVRQWQELFYETRYKAVQTNGPDYVALANAFGIKGLRVEHKNDVDHALRAAANHNGPFLLDMAITPEENVYPLVPPGASLEETVEDPRVVRMREPLKLERGGTVSYP